MNKFVVLFFFNTFLGNHLVGQNHTAWQTKITGTRFSLTQQFDFQYRIKNNLLELGLGYDLGRLIQYQHFAPGLQLSYAHELVQQEQLTVSFQMNYVALLRLYPSNPKLTLHASYFGYGLSFGARWQFIQDLGLGLAILSTNAGSVQLMHDFRFSFGVRHIFKRNVHEN